MQHPLLCRRDVVFASLLFSSSRCCEFAWLLVATPLSVRALILLKCEAYSTLSTRRSLPKHQLNLNISISLGHTNQIIQTTIFTYSLPYWNTPFHFIYTYFGTLCTYMTYKPKTLPLINKIRPHFFTNHYLKHIWLQLFHSTMSIMFILTHICIQAQFNIKTFMTLTIN